MTPPTGQAYWCSVCSAIKRETNHWHIVLVSHDNEGCLGLYIHDFDAQTIADLQRFEGTRAGADEWAIGCGESCVHTLVSRYLQARTLNPVPSNAAAAGGVQ